MGYNKSGNMDFLKSPIGRKLVMSVTGFFMLVFVVGHLLGNMTIYSGPGGINAYARFLHRLWGFLWAVRLTMGIMLALHVFYGVQLTIENRAAKERDYAVGRSLSSTFAGRNMIWTGLLIGAFIIYHLLHFTFQITNPAISAAGHQDAMGRPDVFTMVVLSFRNFFISLVYICAMAVLGLHLGHAVQSAVQTVGLNGERTFPLIRKSGTAAAILIALGFAAFPIVILAGIIR
jgi:succinate dehydrogenase / fumarate reductase cytochrome b subunit